PGRAVWRRLTTRGLLTSTLSGKGVRTFDFRGPDPFSGPLRLASASTEGLSYYIIRVAGDTWPSAIGAEGGASWQLPLSSFVPSARRKCRPLRSSRARRSAARAVGARR